MSDLVLGQTSLPGEPPEGSVSPPFDRDDVLIFGLPLVAFWLGLEATASGISFGPSALARSVAILWGLGGGLACLRLSATLRRILDEALLELLLRLLLLLCLLGTFYGLFASFPRPIIDRVEALVTNSAATGNAATFQVLAAEVLQDPGVLDDRSDALLALAAYRQDRLRQPSAGLLLAGLAGQGFLTFETPDEVVARAALVLKTIPPASSLRVRTTVLTSNLWRSIDSPIVGGAPLADPGEALPKPLSSLGECESLVGGGSGPEGKQASRSLKVLARSRSSWSWPCFHVAAARMLARLGKGREARLEMELAGSMGKGSTPLSARETLLSLEALARSSLEKARTAETTGRITEAAERWSEALSTDPACLPPTQVVLRQNIEAWLEEEFARCRTLASTGRDRLGTLLAGDAERQIVPWAVAGRLLKVAWGFKCLGQPEAALKALAAIDVRFADPYLRFKAETLARAWSGR